MNYCKARAASIQATIDPESPSTADVKKFEDLIRRSERLRNHLIEANTRLVMSIARKFADDRNCFDDLLSHGIASLMHAVEKFDFGRGFRFSTYATCAVRRDLYRMVMGRKKELSRYSTGCDEKLEVAGQMEEGINEQNWQRLSSAMDKMLECLDSRERAILEARYGLDGSTKRPSYSRLGKDLGISKERVRQLANRALDRLREVVGEYRLEALLP
ncbi:RNA polymerase sigma factor SigA [Pirellulimonas nuda]|uniref:RNA polymerase sigma factor SigA n=2 Tax=Pirellulimonas nuda TaxID=2528009 RepID=A0A518DAZ3_9BACT|nr:RNA polymerase sigma factor SigA [Pirellulimonas nuda]